MHRLETRKVRGVLVGRVPGEPLDALQALQHTGVTLVAKHSVRCAHRTNRAHRRLGVVHVHRNRTIKAQLIGRPMVPRHIFCIYEALLLGGAFCSTIHGKDHGRTPATVKLLQCSVKEFFCQDFYIASGPLADTYFLPGRISDNESFRPSAHNGPMFMVSVASRLELLTHGCAPFEGRRFRQLLSIWSLLVVSPHVSRLCRHTGQSHSTQDRRLPPKQRTPGIFEHSCASSPYLKLNHFLLRFPLVQHLIL